MAHLKILIILGKNGNFVHLYFIHAKLMFIDFNWKSVSSAFKRYKTCYAIYGQKDRIKSERHRWLRPSHSRLCINWLSEPGRLMDGCVCQWVKMSCPQQVSLQGKMSHYLWDKKLGEPQSLSGYGRKKKVCFCWEMNPISLVVQPLA
jgi:hypothetical protein